ncbi:hypothetical protein MUK42_04746 [Musa troglodytarum]|uniref:Uncharacterized protein n=1 Tax=Musa troglodytarum TaxID=320322 RepID=A0A9E7EVL0_9LILI|nr:hypothetical protein MUK42_04746 [Musa troglodytarum]
MAARRAVNQSRRLPDSASIPLVSSLHPKSRSTPLLSVGLVLLGAFLLIGYSYSSSGGFVRDKEAIHKEEDDTEAWGVEPYDLEDADSSCKRLIRKGFVRSADIKFSLPYRPKSFSVVIVSDALDYLSPKYLNKTLPDLARVSSDGLVIFSGYPGQQRAKVSELAKFGKPVKLRSSSWWIRYFVQTGLQEKAATKKFEQAASRGLTNRAARFFTSSHR